MLARFARRKEQQQQQQRLATADRRRRKGRRGCGWTASRSGVYNKACRLQDTRLAGRYQTGPATFGASPQNPRSGKPECCSLRRRPVKTPATSWERFASTTTVFVEICDGREPPFRLGARCEGGCDERDDTSAAGKRGIIAESRVHEGCSGINHLIVSENPKWLGSLRCWTKSRSRCEILP